jgi:hypothetical protein
MSDLPRTVSATIVDGMDYRGASQTDFERGAEAMRAEVGRLLKLHQVMFLHDAEERGGTHGEIMKTIAKYVGEIADLVNELKVQP